MVNFEEVSVEEINNNPEAIKYLEQGAAGFGGIISVAKILHKSDYNKNLFVVAKNEIKLLAVAYLTITQQEFGRVLTSVLLGGDNLSEWHHELRDFYYRLAIKYDCDQFMYMGRRGFKRYFPELDEVATVFRVILKPSS